MKNIIKFLLLSTIAMFIVACSKDKDDNLDTDGGDIVGIWVCEDFDEGVAYTICFKSNGTGWMEWSDEDGLDSFQYSAKNGSIFFEDEYDYWVCEYTIKGKTLTIYGNPWGEDDNVNLIILTRK